MEYLIFWDFMSCSELLSDETSYQSGWAVVAGKAETPRFPASQLALCSENENIYVYST